MGSRIGYMIRMGNRIKQLMKDRNLSRDDVAAEMDLHPITVSKLINGKMKLTVDYIERFARLFNVPPEQVIAPPSNTRIVKVRGHLEAGAYADSTEWTEDDWYDVAIPDDPALRNFDLFAGEIRGPSMNKRYPERTVVVFSHLSETGEQLQLGRRYVVERERPDGHREATVKALWRDDDGKLWLIPESTHPQFQQPIPLEGGPDDTVRILGRVHYSVQREE